MSSYRGFVALRAIAMPIGLLTLAAPLLAQGTRGHFYHVNSYQVRPGREKAYDSALVHVVGPVFDEMVRRKAMVSYLLLAKVAGSGENTNLVIVEVGPMPPGAFQQQLEAASQAALHRSWDDASAAFPELRRFVHAEHYRPAGQED